MKEKESETKPKSKKATITYFGVSVIWLALAIFERISKDISSGTVYLCLGALFLSLGAISSRNKEKNGEEK